jgi:hypothetical protein
MKRIKEKIPIPALLLKELISPFETNPEPVDYSAGFFIFAMHHS